MSVYLPPDANPLLAVMDHCLRSRDQVNVVVAGKQSAPHRLAPDAALAHGQRGIGIWDWASNDGGKLPDVVVLACCGDVPTVETLAADVIDRVPSLGARYAALRQHMLDERLRCRARTRRTGEDTPDVRDWRWARRWLLIGSLVPAGYRGMALEPGRTNGDGKQTDTSRRKRIMDTSPPQPIVAVVDGSDHAYKATEWAAELASTLGAPLHLLDIQSSGVGRRSTPTWLGMLRVAAWRAGADPDVIESSSGRLSDLLAQRADTARLLVLGVDLVAVTAESATVSELAERSSCPIAVVRGHGPNLRPPLHGPVVVASGPDVPAFTADLAAAFRATVSMVNIEDGDADVILPNLLEQARHARAVVLASPMRPTGPHPWLADSSRQLIERAICPVVVIGSAAHERPGVDGTLATTSTA